MQHRAHACARCIVHLFGHLDGAGAQLPGVCQMSRSTKASEPKHMHMPHLRVCLCRCVAQDLEARPKAKEVVQFLTQIEVRAACVPTNPWPGAVRCALAPVGLPWLSGRVSRAGASASALLVVEPMAVSPGVLVSLQMDLRAELRAAHKRQQQAQALQQQQQQLAAAAAAAAGDAAALAAAVQQQQQGAMDQAQLLAAHQQAMAALQQQQQQQQHVAHVR